MSVYFGATGYSVPTMLEPLRRAAIGGFVIFHFAALILWVFPPYAPMVLNQPQSGNPLKQFERHLFDGLQQLQKKPIPQFIKAYIDVIGMHQYWDFFAPSVPKVHRYLRVCGSITQGPGSDQFECPKLRYKSYTGRLGETTKPHLGQNSRSYRLAENLINLQRDDLFETFTRYWGAANSINPENYLIVSEYLLSPDRQDTQPEPERRDKVIWIWP